jgi:membrane-associated phospholipid phosphatase
MLVMAFRRALVTAVVAAFLALAGDVRAEDAASKSLEWDGRWARFHVAEYVSTGVLLAGVGVGLFALPQRVDKWSGGGLGDDWFRDRLTLGNYEHRQDAVLVGDVFYYGLTFYPVLVDVGIAALAVHQSPDVAWQMFAIDAQAFALTGFISTYTQKLVGRNRPFASKCAAEPDYDPDCGDAETRSQSLVSGHTAMAFTGAGLICAHHSHLALYGGRAADLLACSTGLVGALTVAFSRVVADRHYVSDAALGAIVGLGSGWLLPELLHYRFDAPFLSVRTRGGSAMILPFASPTGAGAMLAGWR